MCSKLDGDVQFKPQLRVDEKKPSKEGITIQKNDAV